MTMFLANPQEVKNRKGHKTDKKDSWWLAHLLRHAIDSAELHSTSWDPRIARLDTEAEEDDRNCHR